MKMKKLMILLCSMLFVGCAYDTPVFVPIETSETCFIIQLEGDSKQGTLKSEDYLRKNMVATKRFQPTYRWVSTGYNIMSGGYLPNERTIVVDRSPETREWRSGEGGTSSRNQGIWAESSDSVGFSTGISMTARIKDHDDAVKFLYNYPPKRQRIAYEKTMYKEAYIVAIADLADVMDQEVRTKVQEIFSYESARYTMDELREKKREILDAVKFGTFGTNAEGENVVQIEGVIDFFAKRGITITAVGMFGGFTYENVAIQQSIDAVFQAQQDENVAVAEYKAAEERKKAMKSLGEGQGDQVLQRKLKEAEGIKAVADAKAYEIEKARDNLEAYLALKALENEKLRIEGWDGRYPYYYLGGGGTNGLNMFLPAPVTPK